MTRAQPGKPPHSKAYFSSFVGFTNPVTGTITCRGHCTWWPAIGKRCASSRSCKAQNAIDRILLATLDVNCVGVKLQETVAAEVGGICCGRHQSWEVVDEVSFLIGAYRKKVLGWRKGERMVLAPEVMEAMSEGKAEGGRMLKTFTCEDELAPGLELTLILEEMAESTEMGY